jgi:HlyD family secretion protein
MATEIAKITPARSLRRGGRADNTDASHALLEFQSPTAALIARPVPFSGRVTVWVILALVTSTIVVAGVFPIDRVVTATGRVVAQASTVVVQPLQTSIVRKINVQEGQLVHAGDVLAELDPTFAQADQGNYGDQSANLRTEVARLRAEANGVAYKSDGTPYGDLQEAMFRHRAEAYALKLENYREKIASLQATAKKALEDVQRYGQRLEVAKIVEAKRRELEKLQVGSQLNTLSALDSRLEIQRGLDEARNTLDSATSDLNAMIRERDGYIAQDRADTSQTLTQEQLKLADAEGSFQKAKLNRKLVELRADQDAIVLSVAKVSVGSVMQSGDQFITMVPTDAPLEVEANVSGRDAGFVHPGEPVTIKFDTFTYSLYGYAKGRVRTVSADSFTNPMEDRNKVLKPIGQQADSTSDDFGPVYYRDRVTLEEIKLHDLPANFRMTPGMPVTAEIKVGERTALGYMLGRIVPHMSEAFREP